MSKMLNVVGRHGLSSGRTVEGSPAGKHLVEDGSEGEEIGTMVDRLAAYLFRRHVPRGTHDVTGIGSLGESRRGLTNCPCSRRFEPMAFSSFGEFAAPFGPTNSTMGKPIGLFHCISGIKRT
jgi:hypothetical protein